MAAYSHITWTCPFLTWDERLVVHCECGVVKFPDWEARCEYVNALCANITDCAGWKRCSLAKNRLLYYERTECDEPAEGGR